MISMPSSKNSVMNTSIIMHNIVITGGAGFVGSSLAFWLKKKFPDIGITCFDNLHRRGSELNIPRLLEAGISFIHGDIRMKSDLEMLPPFDLLIECSAEPSVLAGITSSPSYLLETNMVGTLNCLEVIRQNNAGLIFLSTSRVYPIQTINSVLYTEESTRFSPLDPISVTGFSSFGISEDFPISGARSLYGATKLCSELFIEEYAAGFGIRSIINRCGMISGPWQMGKVDQGVVMHWVMSHIQGLELSYIGYGGEGKQVRDVLHITDLCRLIEMQILQPDLFVNRSYNVGGGPDNSVSLQELTRICQTVTDNQILIRSIPDTRPNDLIWYVTDNRRITSLCGWKPEITVQQTVTDIASWIMDTNVHLIRALAEHV